MKRYVYIAQMQACTSRATFKVNRVRGGAEGAHLYRAPSMQAGGNAVSSPDRGRSRLT